MTCFNVLVFGVIANADAKINNFVGIAKIYAINL